MLELIKKKKVSWSEYESGYLDLIAGRKADGDFLHETLNDGDCLLCSEHTPERCHRRIVAERFKSIDSRVEIVHL